jgi:hypothetical protein
MQVETGRFFNLDEGRRRDPDDRARAAVGGTVRRRPARRGAGGDGEIRIARSVTGPGLFDPDDVIARYPLSVFDPATGGAILEFVDAVDGPLVARRPLTAGELEQITGMTKAELEARRDQLLERRGPSVTRSRRTWCGLVNQPSVAAGASSPHTP